MRTPTQHKLGFQSLLNRDTASVKVSLDPSVSSALNESEMGILQTFVDFLKDEISKDSVDVFLIDIYVFDDPEGYQEIVFSLNVSVPSEIALPFWDRLGDRLEKWLPDQADATRSTVHDKFAISIRWCPSI